MSRLQPRVASARVHLGLTAAVAAVTDRSPWDW
jgi:hypothetical protein